MSIAKLRITDLPKTLRGKQIGKLTKANRDEIKNLLLVKELIREGFKEQAKITQKVIQEKRARGFCGGFIYCLNYSGDKFMCADCKYQKAHPRYHRRQSMYGELREIDKAQSKGKR